MWYFAYGSNLLVAQLVARTGATGEGAKRATLPGYRLVFDKIGTEGGTFANIVAPGDGVRGVIYPFDEAKFAAMDRFESGYSRLEVEVMDEDSVSVRAFTYVAKPSKRANGQPTSEYLGRILRGAREHGLPEEYIRSIESAVGNG